MHPNTKWTIREVVAATGLTSRTLRHYDEIGLLTPSSAGPGGVRQYDQAALVRLQRILLWRELGVPLAEISQLLNGELDDARALGRQRDQLQRELCRIRDQLAAVDSTMAALKEGELLMPQKMFEGFDHSHYDAEVRRRWGNDAANRSNQWWEDLGDDGRKAFRMDVDDLNSSWDEVIASEAGPTSEGAQAVAARHLSWLKTAWHTDELPREAVEVIAHMYVDDPRFAKNYNRVSPAGAEFVRDALLHCISI